jgi:hypothetical protein
VFALLVVVDAADAKRCRPAKNVLPTSAINRDAINIRAINTSCAFARSMPRKFILYMRYGAMNPQEYSLSALGLGAWTCRAFSGNAAPVRCRSGNRRVSWRLS